jgi:hypothetical protein
MNIVHKPRDDRLSHPFRIATRKTAAATSTRSCNCCYVTHLSNRSLEITTYILLGIMHIYDYKFVFLYYSVLKIICI